MSLAHQQPTRRPVAATPYGSRSIRTRRSRVEVDAIPPEELRALVGEAIEQHVDPDMLTHIEATDREVLTRLAGGTV